MFEINNINRFVLFSVALIIFSCSKEGSDGFAVDCGDNGPTVRISYYLQSSETFEIIVDSNTFK